MKEGGETGGYAEDEKNEGQALRVNIRMRRIVVRRVILRLARKGAKCYNRREDGYHDSRLARRGAKGYPLRAIRRTRTRIRWVIMRLT
jgi:hypothetical protein